LGAFTDRRLADRAYRVAMALWPAFSLILILQVGDGGPSGARSAIALVGVS
jgi:hypothetical protein